MKYTVHLYKAVRITMDCIEADSQEEAARIADEQCDVAEAMRTGSAEPEECERLGATVDEEDDEDYRRTRYHQGPAAEQYLGNTPITGANGR